MAKVITLTNGKSWQTQTAALEHFKMMLARYGDGDVIDNSLDRNDLLALVKRYDMTELSGQSKLGAGVERFERRLNQGDGYSTSGFWIVRVDGTETDFSYITAVKGQPKPVAQEYYDACRNAVNLALQRKKQEQFDRFADDQGRLQCDVTGTLVTYGEAQLRHAKPWFRVMVEEFRIERNWQWDQVGQHLTLAKDSQISTQFLDEKIAKAFREYHHMRAILRIVSKQALNDGKLGADVQVKREIRFVSKGLR